MTISPAMGLRKPKAPCTNKKALHLEGLENGCALSVDYFAALEPRLNFVVNFSTRPAVSTRRFSPV
jgi:hypothetical protein